LVVNLKVKVGLKNDLSLFCIEGLDEDAGRVLFMEGAPTTLEVLFQTTALG
jgi:hypothetical protein